MQNIVNNFKEILGIDRVRENVRMCEHTSFKIGGPVDLFLIPKDEDSLQKTISLLIEENIPWFILGNGTNLLVKDKGFKGAAIFIGEDFAEFDIRDTMVTAGAGQLLTAVASKAAQNGLSGLEFASGIPGSVGGALYMNAGAYGGEMFDVVTEAYVYSVVDRKFITVNKERMNLSYRDSVFRHESYVILRVNFGLCIGDIDEISMKITDYKERRTHSQPLNLPSAGSFFKRPEGAYAAKLIDEAGLKGRCCGGAQVSEKHAGFIVNTGGATADDVLTLMRTVQSEVMNKSGILLQPEPEIIGED